MCLKCTNEKCLNKANKWMRNGWNSSLPDRLYFRYMTYNQWLSEMSDDNLATFFLLVAHSEYDK